MIHQQSLTANNKKLLEENRALYHQNKKGFELLEAEKEQIVAKLIEKAEREKKRRTDGDIRIHIVQVLLILCYCRMPESCEHDSFTSSTTCRRARATEAVSQCRTRSY